MEITNRDRVGRAMDLLMAGLVPFVSRNFIDHHKGQAARVLQQILGEPVLDTKNPFRHLDTAALLKVMWDSWNEVYRNILGRTERNLVNELRDVRRRWAHQEAFSNDDAHRALDSTHRLLRAVSAPAQADEVEKLKMEQMELLRVHVEERPEEHARTQHPSTAGTDLRESVRKGVSSAIKYLRRRFL